MATTEQQPETNEKVDLIVAFLQWVKQSHGAALWTPDPWSPVSMSEDDVPGEVRAQQFLGLPTPWLEEFWESVDASIKSGRERMREWSNDGQD